MVAKEDIAGTMTAALAGAGNQPEHFGNPPVDELAEGIRQK